MKSADLYIPKEQTAIITTCKGRLHHLKRTLATNMKFGRVFLMDDGCPDECGDWVAAHYPTVYVLRSFSETTAHFHKTALLNITAAKALSEGYRELIFCDADCFIRDLPRLKHDRFYIAHKDAGADLTGFLAVPADFFIASGGFDPCITTWGGEDAELRMRMHLLGIKHERLLLHALDVIPHSDHERLRFQVSDDMKRASVEANANYVNRKFAFWLGDKNPMMRADLQDLAESKLRELILVDHEEAETRESCPPSSQSDPQS